MRTCTSILALVMWAFVSLLMTSCSSTNSDNVGNAAPAGGSDGSGPTATAVLQRLVGPETTFTQLTATATDPSGFILVSGNASGIHSYRITNQATGAVTPVESLATTGTPVSMGMVIGPDGTHVLVVATDAVGAGNVESFAVNGTTGDLQVVTTNARVGNGRGVAVVATAVEGTPVAYAVSDDKPGTIQLFSIGNGGVLTAVPAGQNGRVSAGSAGFASGLAVAIVAQGRQILYVSTSTATNNVNGFLLGAGGIFDPAGLPQSGLPVTVGNGGVVTGLRTNFLPAARTGGNVLLVATTTTTAGQVAALLANADGSLTAKGVITTGLLPGAPVVVANNTSVGRSRSQTRQGPVPELEPPGPEFVLTPSVGTGPTGNAVLQTEVDALIAAQNQQIDEILNLPLPVLVVDFLTPGQSLLDIVNEIIAARNALIDSQLSHQLATQISATPTGNLVFQPQPDGLQPLVVEGGIAPAPPGPPPPPPVGLAPPSVGTLLFSPRTDSTLREFVASASGALVEQTANAQAIGSGAQAVSIKPDPFVYSVNTNDGTITAFAINSATGGLTPVPGSPFPAGTTPRKMAVVSDTFAYVVGGGNTGTVTAFAITPTTGVLSQVGAPLSCGSFPNSLVADPTGQFLYVNTGHGFSIAPTTGALTPLPGSPFTGLGGPLAMDPRGKFLYGGGQGIQVNAIGPTGVPRPVPGLPFLSSATSFNAIMVHPMGQFVYATHFATPANPQGEIVAALVAPAGTLTAVPGSPFTGGGMSGPIGGIVEPDGKFLYINSPIFNTCLSGFSIDPTTGALTPLAGSPFPAQGLLDLATVKFP